MADLIKTEFPADQAEKMNTQLTDMLNVFEPYSCGLTKEQRSGIRGMAEGREGYVRSINQVALVHPNELRRKDDPLLLDGKIKYDELLESMRQRVIKLHELIEDTQMSNSKDIMAVADAFNNAFQNSRARNSALDEALEPIDEYNKRFGSTKKDEEPGTTTPGTQA